MHGSVHWNIFRFNKFYFCSRSQFAKKLSHPNKLKTLWLVFSCNIFIFLTIHFHNLIIVGKYAFYNVKTYKCTEEGSRSRESCFGMSLFSTRRLRSPFHNCTLPTFPVKNHFLSGYHSMESQDHHKKYLKTWYILKYVWFHLNCAINDRNSIRDIKELFKMKWWNF